MPNTLYHPQNLCPATPRCLLHLSYVSPDSSPDQSLESTLKEEEEEEIFSFNNADYEH
jgi:hypothetical protein